MKMYSKRENRVISYYWLNSNTKKLKKLDCWREFTEGQDPNPASLTASIMFENDKEIDIPSDQNELHEIAQITVIIGRF